MLTALRSPTSLLSLQIRHFPGPLRCGNLKMSVVEHTLSLWRSSSGCSTIQWVVRESSRQLLTLKQGSRSTADFAIEFRTIASGSGWNDEALMACFQGGLSGPILDELVTREPATDLESLITMAIRLDNRLRERESTRRKTSPPRLSGNRQPYPARFSSPSSERLEPPEDMQLGAFQTLPCREGSPHEGESLPILRCIWAFPSPLSRAPGKRPSPPSYRRAVMGKISAPPPNAVLSFPVTLSWEGHQHQVRAMIDSGAAGDFLDRSLVRRLGIPSQLLPRPQTVTALDGRPLEPGCITEITYPLRLTVLQHQHMEEFYLIDSPEFPVILGYPWLHKHNPCIDWLAGTILSWGTACQVTCPLSSPLAPSLKNPSTCLESLVSTSVSRLSLVNPEPLPYHHTAPMIAPSTFSLVPVPLEVGSFPCLLPNASLWTRTSKSP